MRPSSRNSTRSASSMVETRWATTRVVTSSASRRPARISASTDGVDRGGGVVEDQHAWLAHQRPGQRDALALSARERDPALADDRVVAAAGSASTNRSARAMPRRRTDLVGRVRRRRA